MTMNMGIDRKDGKMSPCRAKDPDHCRFHKKGSHVPMDDGKMMEWNEKVDAKSKTNAPRRLSKADSRSSAGPAKTDRPMDLTDIEDQLRRHITGHGLGNDLNIYSNYDFTELVDEVKYYSEKHEGIRSLDDINKKDLDAMIGRHAEDPNIIDNDGGTIRFSSWTRLEHLMREDDEDAYDTMMRAGSDHSAQELFDIYSEAYRDHHGGDWEPDLTSRW